MYAVTYAVKVRDIRAGLVSSIVLEEVQSDELGLKPVSQLRFDYDTTTTKN